MDISFKGKGVPEVKISLGMEEEEEEKDESPLKKALLKATKPMQPPSKPR